MRSKVIKHTRHISGTVQSQGVRQRPQELAVDMKRWTRASRLHSVTAEARFLSHKLAEVQKSNGYSHNASSGSTEQVKIWARGNSFVLEQGAQKTATRKQGDNMHGTWSCLVLAWDCLPDKFDLCFCQLYKLKLEGSRSNGQCPALWWLCPGHKICLSFLSSWLRWPHH